MSLLIIQARLQSYYYRQPAALCHDAQLLASNACTFNGEGGEIAQLAESEQVNLVLSFHVYLSLQFNL